MAWFDILFKISNYEDETIHSYRRWASGEIRLQRTSWYTHPENTKSCHVRVAKLVDALALGASPARGESSSLSSDIKYNNSSPCSANERSELCGIS